MGVKSIAKGSAYAAGLAAFVAGSLFTGQFAANAKPKAGKEDTSRRVCRMVMPTGSRMTTRICRTQAEWDRSQDQTQDGVLQHQVKETTLLERGAGPF